jgi:hypothetical protein
MRASITIIAVLVTITLCYAEGNWRFVTGEMSEIIQIKGKYERENFRAVITYNQFSGEVRFLKSNIDSGKIIRGKWVSLPLPEINSGEIQVIFAEHTLISGLSNNDVVGQSLYSPFLLDKNSGKLWRLLDDNKKMSWQQLPVPEVIENGKWSISSCEHTIATSKLRRQNIYSVFLPRKLQEPYIWFNHIIIQAKAKYMINWC